MTDPRDQCHVCCATLRPADLTFCGPCHDVLTFWNIQDVRQAMGMAYHQGDTVEHMRMVRIMQTLLGSHQRATP